MLPTIAPALRAQFSQTKADRRDNQRAQVRAGLPAPRVVAARIALALCEVEAGHRPVQQLGRTEVPTECEHNHIEWEAEFCEGGARRIDWRER